MRYRVKEECGLCGKTLLLRPHLKKAHQVKTWDEYVLKLKELKGRKKFQKRPTDEKETPSGGLHSLLKEINPEAAVQKKQSRTICEPVHSPDNEGESPPSSPQYIEVPYTEEEFLRFCVHNTNLYMVLATHQAIKNGKQDPAFVLNYLSKNKLNIDYCKYVVHMNFIPKLYGYYRFAGYYPYAKEKCISCTLNSCSCGRLPRSFYTFCRRACNQASFDCTVCKNWGSGYNVCEDFFWCEVCTAAAKKFPV